MRGDNMPTIGFQTSCYQNSYELLLEDGLLERYLSFFSDIDFTEKRVMINNITNTEYNNKKIANLISKYPHVNFHFTSDNPNEILNYFNLTAFDLFPGIYYSIQHFTGIYYSNCDYLFHVSEDCNIDNLDSKYIKDCIDILESNDDYLYAQPMWGTNPDKGAVEESLRIDGKFHIAKGSTDQIYFIKVKNYKKDIYHFEHPDSNRYPPKGGNSFERRVNSYMWCNNKYRAIHKDYYYIHGFYDNIIKEKNHE